MPDRRKPRFPGGGLSGQSSPRPSETEGGLSGQPSPRHSHSSERTTPAAAGREDLDEARSSPPPTADGEDVAGSPPSEQEEQVERDLGELLADVERERDEYLELARRTKADFENYRKRVAGETAMAEKRGRADLARQLLPVLDNLERALAAAEAREDESGAAGAQGAEQDDRSLIEGVRLVCQELARILERSGIESYEPAGEPFDPHLHEAMMTRPAAPQEAGKVLEVLEKGYRLDGQVLRPARVIVGEQRAENPDEAEGSGK